MAMRDERRREVIGRIADHILAAGLAQTGVRTLAQVAGTSDRMLLYYFANKDEILREALGAVAFRLAGLLDAAIPSGTRLAFDDLLTNVSGALRGPVLQPFMHVWFELVARAARGEQPFRMIAGLMADGFLAWISERLIVEKEADRRRQATLLLATVDGLALLDAVGRGEAATVVSGATAKAGGR